MSSITSQEDIQLRSFSPPPRPEPEWSPGTEEPGVELDWSSWYLTDEDDMGEGGEQNLIIRALISILTQWGLEKNWHDVHLGADQFFAWMKNEPLVRVSPDVYLLDHPPPRPLPASWQTWRPGHRPPRLAFEIVSEHEWRKDYQEAPKKYDLLGTRELVVFDPEAAAGRATGPGRVALQVFRREAEGRLVPVYRGPGPARSEELEAWLVVQHQGPAAMLRLSRDAEGQDLVPTVEQAREQAEQARQQERIAREQAEQQLAAALAELERIKQERNASS
jgi:Uma2 family endonuclease